MKRIILLTLLIPVLAHAQRYGHTSAGAAGAGSTANVRANTGWTSNGTTAQDTLATYYLINGKFQRQMWVDTDNDSVIIAPHALFPLAGKDATSLLFAFDSTGRLGLNALTSAQARRAMFNVLGRATNDTLLVFSNDGGGVVGDSSALMNSAGKWGFGSATIASDEKIHITHTANVPLAVETATADAGIRIKNSGSGGHSWFIDSASGASVVGTGNLGFYDETAAAIRLLLGASGYIGLGAGPAQLQGYVTIRTSAPTSDSLFVVRNDKNSTLDSTMMVFANGDGYFGGKNLYLGANRVRSVTGDTAFVFYSGTTQVFAILANGSTADLVAGTPPTLWRNGPPQEYIWLLRIGVLLLLLLVAFKVYDYAKPRIRKHKTLPGEI